MRGDDDALRPPAGQLDGDAAEQRRERDERTEHLEVGLVDDRDVDGVRDDAPVERGDDLLGDDHTGAVLRLVRRGREVRRHDDLVELEQRSLVGLGGEHVERGAGELARLEGLEQRLLVDERAARGVHEPCAVAHLRDRVAVDQAARLVGQRRVQRHDLRGAQQLLEGLGALDAELAEALAPDERVVGEDGHPEPDGPARDLLADAPEADARRASCPRARRRSSGIAPSGRA